MKINSQILSIPPYISTSWKNIASIHLEDQSDTSLLIITLHNGSQIEVPDLELPLIEIIFAAHMHYIELEEKTISNKSISSKTPHGPSPTHNNHFSMELFTLDNASPDTPPLNALLHDPSQANIPSLPPEILEKLGQIAQAMGINDPQSLPQPEQNCNCIRCQIARAIQNSLRPKEVSQEEEEVVSDEELSFNSWNVMQKADKLYIVTNPLEDTEQYQVHLGTPIGCTCGHEHCEHIKAVLKS